MNSQEQKMFIRMYLVMKNPALVTIECETYVPELCTTSKT